jgi:aspartyl-tRNA(Asn)/glutamyl-tRNA(Gln) amidotransferase subunit C
MAVTFDDVRHIAALARLGVDESRLPALAEELSKILSHMNVLELADTAGVEPGDSGRWGGASAMPLRDDSGTQYPLARPRDAFAPVMRDGFFLVPRLATHEDAGE